MHVKGFEGDEGAGHGAFPSKMRRHPRRRLQTGNTRLSFSWMPPLRALIRLRQVARGGQPLLNKMLAK
jgi:hypothetical protein